MHRPSIWKILKSYGIPDKIINLIKLFYEKYECSVVAENNLTNWFIVRTGVRQGCILSPILFLITIDWVLRKTYNKAKGIQWKINSHLEDLDFADDLALLSRLLKDLQTKTTRLETFAKQVGLRINIGKTKTMHMPGPPNTPIRVENQEIEAVDDFTYLGSVISPDNGAEKDIKSRLAKAKGAFAMLRPIWRSKQYNRKTKLKIFKSNVLSVLLYGAECWRMTETDLNKLETFQNKCLRQIHGIYYPNMISNVELHERSGVVSMEKTITKRRLKLVGHIMRMQPERAPKIALRWTPSQGRRNRGRPKITWRRTVEKDLLKLGGGRGLTWGEASALAQDRRKWRILLRPLAPP